MTMTQPNAAAVQAVVAAWRSSDYDDLLPLEYLAPVAQLAVAALADAGRLLPEPTETRTEWGIWWYGPIGDGIRLTQDKFSSRQAAEEHAPTRVGDYGITRYEIRRREHRYFADHSSWSGDWVVAEAQP